MKGNLTDFWPNLPTVKGGQSYVLLSLCLGWENTQDLRGCHSALAGRQTLKLGVKTVDTLRPNPRAGFSLNGVSALAAKTKGTANKAPHGAQTLVVVPAPGVEEFRSTTQTLRHWGGFTTYEGLNLYTGVNNPES